MHSRGSSKYALLALPAIVLGVACAKGVDLVEEPSLASGGSAGGAGSGGSGAAVGGSGGSGAAVGGSGGAFSSGGGGSGGLTGAAGTTEITGGAAGTAGAMGGAAGTAGGVGGSAGSMGGTSAGGTGGGVTTMTYRYAKLVALSEVSDRTWSSTAELQILTTGGTMLNRSGWTITADSQETVDESVPATNAIDGDTATFWHTEWSLDMPADPAHPHELVVDLGAAVEITGFSYLPRQQMENGRIADYEFYVSEDGIDWGAPVASGTFPNSIALQQVTF